MYITMKYKFILHDKNILVHVTSKQPPIPCFKPHKTWRLPTNHRLCYMSRWVFQPFRGCECFSEFPLICRSLFRYSRARGKFLTLKNIVIVFIYTQINSIREWGSAQTRHLLVIFENFENYLGQNWEYLEQNWIFFEQIWHFHRATNNMRATKWRWGILNNNVNNRGNSLACILFIWWSRNSEDASRGNSGVLLYFCFT